MKKYELKDAAREMLCNLPHYAHVHVFDNGGKTADRYTIYMREQGDAMFAVYSMSNDAWSPNGFNQFSHEVSTPADVEDMAQSMRWGDVPLEVAMAIIYRLND